ncbi:MAG: hypothetical protein AAFX99_02830 [Myxococcota bacterium]
MTRPPHILPNRDEHATPQERAPCSSRLGIKTFPTPRPRPLLGWGALLPIGRLRAWMVVMVAVVVWMGAAEVSAQEDKKDVSCNVATNGTVRCDLDLRTKFRERAMRARLRNGFHHTVLYRIYIRRASDNEPVALTARRILTVFELWDEVYYVTQGDTKSTVRSEGDMIQRLAVFDQVLAARGLPPGSYYADVIVELNPLSKEEEAEIRSWIARSRGGHRTFTAGDRSFFGTFVSLFTNIRPGDAEDAFQRRSSLFTVK